MSSLGRIRSWQRRSAFRTSTALIAVWLNLVMQSCAMAVAPVEGCPHCPAEAMFMPGGELGCEQLNAADDPDALAQTSKPPSPLDHLGVADSPQGRLPVAETHAVSARLAQLRFAPSHDPPVRVLFGVYLN
ncbi:MAG TPA: hypothetical protein VLD39_01680 [Gammaproteobacteria bacterium]|nr:hypothetical protein [Gammaproteobacteria bacterium]